MSKIVVTELVEDFALYPRMAVSDVYVNELAEVLRSGKTLPPIVACKASKRIVDGFHRVRAYVKVFGADYKVNVRWQEYPDEAALFADAIARNAEHGRRMCKKDFVRCVHKGETFGFDTEYIATLAGLTTEKLEKLTVARTAYAENGTPLVLGAGLYHLAGKTLTKAQRKANRKGFGNVMFYAGRLADLLEADALDLSNEKMVAELTRLKAVLERVI